MASAYEYAVGTEEVLLGVLRDGQMRTMDGLVEAPASIGRGSFSRSIA